MGVLQVSAVIKNVRREEVLFTGSCSPRLVKWSASGIKVTVLPGERCVGCPFNKRCSESTTSKTPIEKNEC